VSWVAGDAADGWESKIEVVDPDPVSCSNSVILLTCSKCNTKSAGPNHMDDS
jgi:hypothetical protein